MTRKNKTIYSKIVRYKKKIIRRKIIPNIIGKHIDNFFNLIHDLFFEDNESDGIRFITSKQGERDYLKNLPEDGLKHSINKPFSDINCWKMLSQISIVLSLLPKPPAKLLDLGCGMGWTSIFFAKRGYDVTGVDISEDMIYYATLNKKKEKIKNLNFLVRDFENMEFNTKFNIVIFFDSLHHSLNEKEALKNAYNLLKPNGICITVEPGVGHSKSYYSIKAMKKYKVTEKDMPPKKIIKIAKEIGFKKFNIFPLLYENINFLKNLFEKENYDIKSNFKNILKLFKDEENSILRLFLDKEKKGILLMKK